MPSKREILSEISKNDLLPFIDLWDLEVVDKRVKHEVIEALARSKKAKLEEILSSLSRRTLKDICRALDLDDGGRAKADSPTQVPAS